MMKLNELRIGSFFQVDNFPPEQVTLDTFATLATAPASLGAFREVPLTAKWLEDFGFKKLTQTNGVTWSKDNNNNFVIVEKITGYYFMFYRNKTVESFRKIRAVHELQDIWYSCTGNGLY